MSDETQPMGPLDDDPGERYERGERIAAGGMGEVWRARDTVLGREVAVKILKREYADDSTFRARFEAEARHAAALHHPGIASVFDYGVLQDGGTPYLVMELVDGKPLSDLLAAGEPFDPEQARLLALQTAEALAVAHAAGVVHRDVKPANLLVTPDGRIKITDFGIARAIDSVAFTQTGQIVGTPQYLSPEQARGNPATAASDVYALGVVLFECLSGRRPFTADTPIATALAQIQQDVPPLPDSVPAGLATIVARALEKDPARRYADGAEMAGALRAAAHGAVPPPLVPVPEPPGEHPQVLSKVGAPVPVAAAAAAPVEVAEEPPVESTDDRERERGPRWPAYLLGLLVLVLLVALLVLRPWEDDGTATDDGTEASPGQSDTLRVRRAAFIGDPVEEAVAELRGRGFKTRVETRENPGDQDAGTVADLTPTGDVDRGATITLQAWGDPPADEPTDEGDNDNGPGNEGDNGNGNSGTGNDGGTGGDTGTGNEPTEPEQTQQPEPQPEEPAPSGGTGNDRPGADPSTGQDKTAPGTGGTGAGGAGGTGAGGKGTGGTQDAPAAGSGARIGDRGQDD